MATVIAAVAAYATDLRAMRTLEGQEVARANGIKSGRPSGSGKRFKVAGENEATTHLPKAEERLFRPALGGHYAAFTLILTIALPRRGPGGLCVRLRAVPALYPAVYGCRRPSSPGRLPSSTPENAPSVRCGRADPYWRPGGKWQTGVAGAWGPSLPEDRLSVSAA